MASGPWDVLTAAQRRGLDDALRAARADEADLFEREHEIDIEDGQEVLVAWLPGGRRLSVRQGGEWAVLETDVARALRGSGS